MRQALELSADLGVVHLTSVAPDRFRRLAVSASRGRVSLIEGGSTIESAGWRPTLLSLKSIMNRTSTWVTYGLIKRGSRRPAAELGTSLAEDWPPVPHFNPRMISAEAFEEEFAPDAFGVQLLGPGFAGRVPGGRDWQQTAAGSDAILLEHAAPEAWFADLFVPFGGLPILPPFPPVPSVLERARDEFAEILLTEAVLTSS